MKKIAPLLRNQWTLLTAAIGGLLVSPSVVHAQTLINSTLSNKIVNGTGMGTTSPVTTISMLVAALLGILGLLAVILIIYAGFTWMTAAGNEEKVKKARGILQAAVIGLIIILSSYGIALYVFSIIEGATGQGVVPT